MSGAPRKAEPGPQMQAVLRGILLVARGDRAGLALFGATSQSYLSSLAPLIAFPLVAAGLMLMRGGGASTVADLLATLSILLTPAVVSFELARLWGRHAGWLRFATAFNWCQWAIPAVGAVMMLLLFLSVALGAPSRVAALVLIGALAGYSLWLHWFVVRTGLQVGRWRAALVVLAMNAATSLLVIAQYIASPE